MIVTHDAGKTITVHRQPEQAAAWELDYGSKPKPFIHPLRTPAGHLLSLAEPYDHMWHRGLWFTFKFVNGDNFWEENVDHGVQRAAGVPEIRHDGSDRVAVRMKLHWIGQGAREPVLVEERSIAFRADDDVDIFDWTSALVAQRDVVLDRTPYTSWGGYGGLSFRGARGWAVARYGLPDAAVSDRPAGHRGAWCDLSGTLDGGAGLSGGLAILDHPGNIRHPTPWYAGGSSMTFINAALLFHEPLALASGEELRLRYRVFVHDGVWERNRVEAESEAFARESS